MISSKYSPEGEDHLIEGFRHKLCNFLRVDFAPLQQLLISHFDACKPA